MSCLLLSNIFDEELRITETRLVDDELSEKQPGLFVTVCADDRVEHDAAVSLTWRRAVD